MEIVVVFPTPQIELHWEVTKEGGAITSALLVGVRYLNNPHCRGVRNSPVVLAILEEKYPFFGGYNPPRKPR